MQQYVSIAREDIPLSFFSRYFERNAEQRYSMQLLEFMLWRRGKFILPAKKGSTLNQYINEEIENFFEKKMLYLPQLQFLVTTRCSLRCKNCNAYIPCFGSRQAAHYDLSPEAFQRDMNRLETTVTGIRRFMLIGGEPLLHPGLASIIECAASSPIISIVEIVTNGTLLPRNDVLDTVKRFNDRVYFHISNYASNPALASRLKHEELFNVFREYGIKHQMSAHQIWQKELPLQGRLGDDAVRSMFANCWLKRCLQIFDGKLAVCPKASSGYALGMVDAALAEEQTDLRSQTDLREQLLAFYQKDFFEVCRACSRIEEEVPAAEQFHQES